MVVPGLSYPEASGYLTLDAGDYPLEIRAAGDTAAALEFDVTLEANTNYTAFAMDAADGVQVIAAVDATGTVMPDTAMGQTSTGTPVLLAGIVLLGLSILTTVRTLGVRTER